MLEKLKSRLVANWKESWRFGSVRLHAIATAVAIYVANNPNAINSILGQLPPRFQTPTLIAAGAAWLALGWLIRIWQGKPVG